MAGIEISTFFTLADTNPLFVVEDKFVRGGCRIVTDTAARDELLTKTYHIKAGMLVVTQSDLKIWQLGTDLQTWTEIPEPVIPYTLPIATNSTLGGVSVGSGLTINGAGVLSASAPTLPGVNILNPTNFFIGSCAPGAFLPIDNQISVSGQTCAILTKSFQQRGPITSLDVVLSLGTIFNNLTGSVKVTVGIDEYVTPFSANTSEPYDMKRHIVVNFPTLDILTSYFITITIDGSNPLNGSQWYIIGIIAS